MDPYKFKVYKHQAKLYVSISLKPHTLQYFYRWKGLCVQSMLTYIKIAGPVKLNCPALSGSTITVNVLYLACTIFGGIFSVDLSCRFILINLIIPF